MVHRLSELQKQSENGTLTDVDRSTIGEEFNQVVAEINRLAASARYGDKQLFDGNTLELQVGPGVEAEDQIEFSVAIDELE